MTLKDKNNILEDLIDASLRQLSKEYSKQEGEPHLFEYWSNTRALDKDKNVCFQAVLDVRVMNVEGKVLSFKRVYDRWLVQRTNTGTVDEPKYGKQLNMEEHRNTCLREVLGKAIGGFALNMALRTKEQIQELYSEVEKETSLDTFTDTLKLTAQDIKDYEARNDVTKTDGQTYNEAKD